MQIVGIQGRTCVGDVKRFKWIQKHCFCFVFWFVFKNIVLFDTCSLFHLYAICIICR